MKSNRNGLSFRGNPGRGLFRDRWQRVLAPVTCLLLAGALSLQGAPKKLAQIISVGKDGRLVYGLDDHANRVPDFSTCGYAGGDRPIPFASVKVTVAPVAGDETLRIQKALNYVAGLPADSHGLRGAVLLLAGRHTVLGGLEITNSGVVLRGQGMGEAATVLEAAGTDRRTLLRIEGQNDLSVQTNSGWKIVDDYVPVGATSFHVSDASGLKVGDEVRIIRPSTREWINFLGMTEFGGGDGDWRLVWHPGSYDLVWDRVIQKVDGTLVTVDAPVTTAMERGFGGGYVERYAWPGRIHEVGVENLRLESAFDPQNPLDENHSWFAVTMENVADAWVRQVTFAHFAGSAVAVYETCKRVTVQDCLSLAPVSEPGGWRRDSFFTQGQQTLFLCCWAEQGRHDFSAGHCAAGPNAFVQCEDTLPLADSGGMGAWSSGTLFDNVRIDGGGLNLRNRGADGEGAGWAAANSVFWQCDASKMACENPPGAQNWAFGCWGEFAGNGIWRDANGSIKPVSLFVAQTADRLGRVAAAGISLMPRNFTEYSNPTAKQAAASIADSLQPAPQLADFIRSSASQNPMVGDTAGAMQVDDLPDPGSAPRPAAQLLAATNGWLVVDGRLLIGGVEPVNWWRGNMRPSEQYNYGVNLTRFAPGRTGPGFTDDLAALLDGMADQGFAALDHHYGLWYDRRREDHERVRRVDGDVWAPFYEQPFARSGQGTAWDGLSKYDLTKFNLWYWSRLRQFADLCGERGRVLFNENYFQHNIIEAGAHWVDCPWRSANNVNGTGFPEPPPFAGDKRIFMAAQFYDVNQPVRRQLHAGFIRQNLNNFTNEPNVIQFTSAEFTGPLAFEQFWLDTVAQWEQETHRHPLIALAAPKNVQDAILADPARAAVVDVICFRYWWQTDQGLFAPNGGESLSPRQFERKWHGGSPGDADVARMTSAYRQRFPDKVVIAKGEDEALHGSWAFLCAGGSMPELPASTDPELLAAIPRMQCWLADNQAEVWGLRRPGQEMLIYLGDGGTVDLSGESGSYQVRVVNRETGQVSAVSKTILAGGRVPLPVGVVWLKRE